MPKAGSKAKKNVRLRPKKSKTRSRSSPRRGTRPASSNLIIRPAATLANLGPLEIDHGRVRVRHAKNHLVAPLSGDGAARWQLDTGHIRIRKAKNHMAVQST